MRFQEVTALDEVTKKTKLQIQQFSHFWQCYWKVQKANLKQVLKHSDKPWPASSWPDSQKYKLLVAFISELIHLKTSDSTEIKGYEMGLKLKQLSLIWCLMQFKDPWLCSDLSWSAGTEREESLAVLWPCFMSREGNKFGCHWRFCQESAMESFSRCYETMWSYLSTLL